MKKTANMQIGKILVKNSTPMWLNLHFYSHSKKINTLKTKIVSSFILKKLIMSTYSNKF